MKHSKVRISKHLSDSFPIQNDLKEMLFNFALEYAIRKDQETPIIYLWFCMDMKLGLWH
jgi:hypothetical protein